MGKVTRWLWGLLGMKKQKEEPSTENPVQSDTREKKRWSFARMGRESGPADQTRNQNTPASGPGESSWMRSHEEKQSKHAIAVAAATAAAADAAVAAAHAAVTVVRLTSHGRRNVVSGGTDYALAVIKIQCALRGYLGRRALRALKALVKLQALVRGFLVRKQAAAALRSMEALLRVQYAMRCHRVNRLRRINNMRPSLSSISKRRLSASSYSSYEHARHALDESPKTEHLNRARSGSRRIHLTRNGPVAEGVYYYPGIYSSPKNLREFDWGVMKGADDQSGRGAWTANNTPRLGNGPPTPLCGDGHLWPNYMTNTESFCAKLRSHSAPRQRPEWPETSTAGAARKRLSLNEIMASRNSFSCVRMNGSCAEFTENANF